MSEPKNIYRHKGMPGCKGSTYTRPDDDNPGYLRITCTGCPLDWSTPDTTKRSKR